ASSAATTAPPAPEPMTTASQSRVVSLTRSSRPRTFVGLGMGPPQQRIRSANELLGALDVTPVLLEPPFRDLRDPGVGVEGDPLADRRRVVIDERDQRLERPGEAGEGDGRAAPPAPEPGARGVVLEVRKAAAVRRDRAELERGQAGDEAVADAGREGAQADREAGDDVIDERARGLLVAGDDDGARDRRPQPARDLEVVHDHGLSPRWPRSRRSCSSRYVPRRAQARSGAPAAMASKTAR